MRKGPLFEIHLWKVEFDRLPDTPVESHQPRLGDFPDKVPGIHNPTNSHKLAYLQLILERSMHQLI